MDLHGQSDELLANLIQNLYRQFVLRFTVTIYKSMEYYKLKLIICLIDYMHYIMASMLPLKSWKKIAQSLMI
jgi:hypothetical protein